MGLSPAMPHRPAGPRIEPPVSEPRLAGTRPAANRGARARRRAAGEVRGVPGIARRRPGQVEGRAAVGELVRGELAHQHGAGGAQPGHGGRVLSRDAVDAGARMAGGQDAGGVVDVLDGERNAVQRPAPVAARDLGFGGARQPPSRPRGVRVMKALSCGSSASVRARGLRVLDRRQLAGPDQGRASARVRS